MKVLIDPGHGGPFTGACSGGVRECDVNLDVALKLRFRLQEAGHTAWLTRDGDYALTESDKFSDISLRAQMAGDSGADLLLSLHCNAYDNPAVNGIEVWTTRGQNNSDTVANHLIQEMASGLPNKKFRVDSSDGDPDREKNFNILAESPTRAVLVEMGFLTNAEEREWLVQSRNQSHMAIVLAKGLNAWRRFSLESMNS